MKKLEKKISVVTGGAGLLGVQHCYALARAGSIVIMTDVDDDKLEKECNRLIERLPGSSITPLFMDVTLIQSVRSAYDFIIKEFGTIDILINNASLDPKVKKKNDEISTNFTRVEDFPIEQWDLQVNIGLKGAFICSQVFGSYMAKNDGGVILNIASDLSVIAPDNRLYAVSGLDEKSQPVKPITYSIIKTGLLGLTRYLAVYWAKNNVRVNALSPGGVFNGHSEEFVRKLTNLIPLGRMAKVDEYCDTIEYLCSDSSSYLTGQNIVLDGGRSII
jgi:NAD(P)-dependent dehydrogenase (short-subunit alcohol dehydrogenase family)